MSRECLRRRVAASGKAQPSLALKRWFGICQFKSFQPTLTMRLKPASYPADSPRQHKVDLIMVKTSLLIWFAYSYSVFFITFSVEETMFDIIGYINFVHIYLFPYQSVMLQFTLNTVKQPYLLTVFCLGKGPKNKSWLSLSFGQTSCDCLAEASSGLSDIRETFAALHL